MEGSAISLQPSPTKSQTHEFASYVHLHLNHFYDNFPSSSHYSLTGTQIVEPGLQGPDTTNDPNTQYFMINETTILCISDHDQEKKKCRLIFRDVCGRNCWTSECFYDVPVRQEHSPLKADFEIVTRRSS